MLAHLGPEEGERLRLADLLAALSLESDLAMGHPPEEAMRTCLLATGLARRTGCSESEAAEVYWTSMLMHVGCTAFAHEQAALFGGDDIAVNAVGSKTDFGNPGEALAFMLQLGRGKAPVERARILVAGLIRGERFGREAAAATCEVAATTAHRLGLPAAVQQGLNQLFERWDGKGAPGERAGDEIALPARLSQLAAQVIVYDRLAGSEGALETVRRRAGAALDPVLVDALSRCAADVLQEVRAEDPWSAVVEAEPSPQRWISDSGIDEVAKAFADLVDLKSTFTLGHSTNVARCAEAAGRALGLGRTEVVALRRAGYLHDLGRVGVPTGIWNKSGPLNAAEWEKVRLHPYHSERILSRSRALAPLATIVGMHHERLDGSGYHRQAAGGSIPLEARVLAAADAYDGRTHARPHRPALSPASAADYLVAEAEGGRLDARAVDAVLSVSGHETAPPISTDWPAGLTDREVDVLRLVSRGLSNREVGRRLFISPKTVGHHVEHIYGKLDISSRAAAALFAVRHDLLRDFDHPSR